MYLLIIIYLKKNILKFYLKKYEKNNNNKIYNINYINNIYLFL